MQASIQRVLHAVVAIITVSAGILFLMNSVSDIQFGFGAVLLSLGLLSLLK